MSITLIIIILVVLVILLCISYFYTEKEGVDGNKSISNYLVWNGVLWVSIIIVIGFCFYREGQIQVLEGNIDFEQEIRKEYSKKTGELVKQDTVWVSI